MYSLPKPVPPPVPPIFIYATRWQPRRQISAKASTTNREAASLFLFSYEKKKKKTQLFYKNIILHIYKEKKNPMDSPAAVLASLLVELLEQEQQRVLNF